MFENAASELTFLKRKRCSQVSLLFSPSLQAYPLPTSLQKVNNKGLSRFIQDGRSTMKKKGLEKKKSGKKHPSVEDSLYYEGDV